MKTVTAGQITVLMVKQPNHKKNKKMKELTKIALNDGQDIRPFHNYISEVYSEIKGKNLSPDYDGRIFNDRIEFYKFLRDEVLEFMIRCSEDIKKDQPADYMEEN